MPDIDSMVTSIAGSKVYAQVDMCHAYWQLPLSKASQELMTIQTPLRFFSLKRVLKGYTDASNHFQAVTSAEFVDINNKLLQWIDEFLMYAKSEAELLETLRMFFKFCRCKGFKLDAKKHMLFTKSAKFCGKIIDKDGIRYDTRSLASLT